MMIEEANEEKAMTHEAYSVKWKPKKYSYHLAIKNEIKLW